MFPTNGLDSAAVAPVGLKFDTAFPTFAGMTGIELENKHLDP